MIRIGQIVENDNNPLMNVSQNYKKLVKKLSQFSYADKQTKFLGCLIVSQTEKRYKHYMIHVLKHIKDNPLQELINSWQENTFQVVDNDYSYLLNEKEREILHSIDLEERLIDHSELFDDGFVLEFYPTMKKATIYWRRLTNELLKDPDALNSLQRLVIYFITSQLLISWESACLHLGRMVLNRYSIDKIHNIFCEVWPVYRNNQKSLI